jgi:ketosteroid isomerase-like protein
MQTGLITPSVIRQMPPIAIGQWLGSFAQAVRSRDIDLGRSLFAPEVVAFGTRAAAAAGLDALVDQQWSIIWNSTRGFTFRMNELHSGTGGDLCWAAVPWESEGIGPDGRPFGRTGRASYVLQLRGERLLAIHSHHSLNPCAEKLAKAPR